MLVRTEDDDRLLRSIDTASQQLIERAIGWSRINSGSRNLSGLDEQAEQLFPVLAELPGRVERIPLPETSEIAADGSERQQSNGAALRLTVREEAPVQLVLTGHYDTVYPVDTQFRDIVMRPDGALHGPGIADMKGGLSVLIGALAAFEAHPLASRVGYRVLLSPDEETGSIASAPLLAQVAQGAHIGMTYEPALADGTLAGARKGSGNFHIVVRGRAAHAGRDFTLGRNAIVAAARIATVLAGINGRREGVTLNVARIEGGSPLNMVPNIAVVRFNIRFPDQAAGEWVRGAIDGALDEGRGDGLSVVLHGAITRSAKPFNPAQAALFEAVKDVGALIGETIGWRPSGGVCEGNNLFAAGVPNIDTLGVRGGDIHSENEFAWPESFAERAKLSALLIAKAADGTIDAPALRALMAETPTGKFD
jgi:glutamate carboxypeptidase